MNLNLSPLPKLVPNKPSYPWIIPNPINNIDDTSNYRGLPQDTDPIQQTAIKYDSDKPRMELLSSIALEEIAKVLTFGAKKYSANNWRMGMDWSRLIGSAMRHLTAFNDGEDKDPESGLSHLAHLGCCVMFLLEYEKTQQDKDDRFVLDIPSNPF